MKTIYLATLPKREVYHYEFTCPHCNTKILLATGVGDTEISGDSTAPTAARNITRLSTITRALSSTLTLTGNSPQAISTGTLTR